MADPTITFGLKELFYTSIGIIVSLLGYNSKTVVNRLNKVEDVQKNNVNKSEYNETIKSLRRDIQDGLKASKEATEKAHDRQIVQFEKFYAHMTKRIDKLVDRDDNN